MKSFAEAFDQMQRASNELNDLKFDLSEEKSKPKTIRDKGKIKRLNKIIRELDQRLEKQMRG